MPCGPKVRASDTKSAGSSNHLSRPQKSDDIKSMYGGALIVCKLIQTVGSGVGGGAEM